MRIGDGVTLDKPIHLIQLDGKGEPASTVTRNVVIAEPGSSATLIESFASLGISAASAQRGDRAQGRRQGGASACEAAA